MTLLRPRLMASSAIANSFARVSRFKAPGLRISRQVPASQEESSWERAGMRKPGGFLDLQYFPATVNPATRSGSSGIGLSLTPGMSSFR
jgi:hypothetical protein